MGANAPCLCQRLCIESSKKHGKKERERVIGAEENLVDGGGRGKASDVGGGVAACR